MALRTEISLRLPNSPGALAGVCRELADERVGVLAMMLEPGAGLRLVADNHVRAAGVLREHHHQITTREVVALRVANAPGGLAPVLALVASAGVNIEYAYSGAADDGGSAIVVVGVDDPARASTLAGV